MIASLAFLITLSVMAKCESNSVWLEPQMSSQSEMYSLMDRYREDILSIRPNIVFCCACKEIIKKAKAKIYKTIQEKIQEKCSSYIELFSKMCFKVANNYKKAIMRILFPGGRPIRTCRLLRLCGSKLGENKECTF
ncbi:hypothetical protein E1301_Tti002754 [Triplophysa tibetana]|uniref:Saposin B-type domain-containing protein n=1 Tax=Triplophysa tibetana TaxID=1572043 RepID=A0A5A9NNT5_9TELE|nr:hypothetical protein E1301_Tti002754 [Triplophysa tibetana]